MASAARSPMITQGAIVLPVVTRGMIDPSAIRRFSIPYTLRLASATESESRPILAVQVWCQAMNDGIYRVDFQPAPRESRFARIFVAGPLTTLEKVGEEILRTLTTTAECRGKIEQKSASCGKYRRARRPVRHLDRDLNSLSRRSKSDLMSLSSFLRSSSALSFS